MQTISHLPPVVLMLLASCTEQRPAILTEIEDAISEAEPF